MKKMKTIIAMVMAAVLLSSTVTTAMAASKPKAPSKISAKEGVYYEYINKHHIQGGDGYSLKVGWSRVSGAAGYLIKLRWNTDGANKRTQTINVTKQNGQYHYSIHDKYNGTIYKSVKDIVYGKGDKNISSSKLSFCVTGGSCEEVEKITIKSYKENKGKKIYSHAKVKKI